MRHTDTDSYSTNFCSTTGQADERPGMVKGMGVHPAAAAAATPPARFEAEMVTEGLHGKGSGSGGIEGDEEG